MRIEKPISCETFDIIHESSWGNSLVCSKVYFLHHNISTWHSAATGKSYCFLRCRSTTDPYVWHIANLHSRSLYTPQWQRGDSMLAKKPWIKMMIQQNIKENEREIQMPCKYTYLISASPCCTVTVILVDNDGIWDIVHCYIFIANILGIS